MPHTIPLVSELEWKATSKSSVRIQSCDYHRSHISSEQANNLWWNNPPVWFTESWRQKVLAAMDSFGKVEEKPHWQHVSDGAHSWKWVDENCSLAKCVMDLRARIESMEGKVKP